MVAAKLTERRLNELSPRPGQQYVVWDGAIAGFGVRVSPAGTRTFILKYRTIRGRVRWKTLGRVGTLALDQARKLAKADVGAVAGGGDPLTQKDTAKDGLTFGTVADRFLAEHVEARRKAATLRLYRLAIDGHLRPAFGARSIAEVTAGDMARLHARLKSTPYLANRVLAVASKLCNWAELQGWRAPHANPCDGLEKYPEHPRRRYLTPPEWQRVGAALRLSERRDRLPASAVVAIRLLLLTGARVSEILSLTWAAVDLAAGTLQLADSKTGRKTIWLSPSAVALLQAWPRFKGSPYVFPGEGKSKRGPGAHRVSLGDAWTWVRTRAKVPGVRLHDLRHSFASLAVSQGYTLPMIGALLGHSQPATTQRYAHLMDDPLRAGVNAIAGTIDAALSRRPR